MGQVAILPRIALRIRLAFLKPIPIKLGSSRDSFSGNGPSRCASSWTATDNTAYRAKKQFCCSLQRNSSLFRYRVLVEWFASSGGSHSEWQCAFCNDSNQCHRIDRIASSWFSAKPSKWGPTFGALGSGYPFHGAQAIGSQANSGRVTGQEIPFHNHSRSTYEPTGHGSHSVGKPFGEGASSGNRTID